MPKKWTLVKKISKRFIRKKEKSNKETASYLRIKKNNSLTKNKLRNSIKRGEFKKNITKTHWKHKIFRRLY
jgi:hypothetical protein